MPDTVETRRGLADSRRPAVAGCIKPRSLACLLRVRRRGGFHGPAEAGSRLRSTAGRMLRGHAPWNALAWTRVAVTCSVDMDDTAAQGDADRRGPVVDVQLRENVAEVHADGLLPHVELLGDFPVPHPFGHELDDLDLASNSPPARSTSRGCGPGAAWSTTSSRRSTCRSAASCGRSPISRPPTTRPRTAPPRTPTTSWPTRPSWRPSAGRWRATRRT